MLNGLSTIIAEYVNNTRLQSFIILLGFVILSKFFLFVSEKILQHFARKSRTCVDDMLLEKTRNPLFFLLIAIGVQAALIPLKLETGTYEIIAKTFSIFFFILAITRALVVIIKSWGKRLAARTKTNADETITPLVVRFTQFFLYFITAIWIMGIWKIDVTPYLAGLGIGGLIIGMAFQDSLRNLFGGISLVLDKNFNIDDAVRLETGELGIVKEIGLRSTKILTYDNEMIFLPNGQLANMRITNFLRPNTRVRRIVDFSVEYGSDIKMVKKAVLHALKSVKIGRA